MKKAVKLSELNWFMTDEYLKHSNKIVVPIGSIKEHGYLSLLTDSLVVEQITEFACKETNIIMAPTITYSISKLYSAFPGTISLSATTFISMMKDIVYSLLKTGFSTIFLVNNGDANNIFKHIIPEILSDYPEAQIVWYDLYSNNSDIIEEILAQLTTPTADHASWIENFPFVRVSSIPDNTIPLMDKQIYSKALNNPKLFRENFPEGVISGKYKVDDTLMKKLFETMVSNLIELFRSY